MARIGIVGTGTIGRPLIYLLAEHGPKIGIDETWFHKRTPLLKEKGKVNSLVEKGARLVVDEDKWEKFAELGHEPQATFHKMLEAVDVVIDCTPDGDELMQKYYKLVKKLRPRAFKGAIAQGGSKENFGKSYAFDINDCALKPHEDWRLRVVSCNTHQVCVVANSLVIKHDGIANLKSADFVIERRASDVSQIESVGSVEVSKPEYGDWGTHQGYDAGLVFKTFIPDLKPVIHTQVSKIPSQYMHVTHWALELKRKIDLKEAYRRLLANPLITPTNYQTTGEVFSEARDNNKLAGRILNQTVLVEPSLQVIGKKIYGICFTPQDGNALLSSIAATLWLLDPKTYKEKMKVFDKYLFKTV